MPDQYQSPPPTLLRPDEILEGYDAVCALYPSVPPLSHWRAWEYAAYRRFQADGRTLDLGCGDGRYFRLIWPDTRDVVGVDLNPQVAEMARVSGVYGAVHVAPAQSVPEPAESFDHVFANCSLEHMDHLDKVLAEVARCLMPGGTLICSVVTNRFQEWSPLPKAVSLAGHREAAASLHKDFVDYHHLVNPLTPSDWMKRMSQAGLQVEVHIPILPWYNSALFLLMDGLWHVKKHDGGEFGDLIHPVLAGNNRFPKAFRKIFEGLLDMELDHVDCSGAVFLARKRG
jgi:SAM-dependent methyltransferase